MEKTEILGNEDKAEKVTKASKAADKAADKAESKKDTDLAET